MMEEPVQKEGIQKEKFLILCCKHYKFQANQTFHFLDRLGEELATGVGNFGILAVAELQIQ